MSEPPFGFPMFGFSMSEEDKRKMEEEHARQEMQMDDIIHGQQALFEELSEEHLKAFRLFLKSLSHSHPDSSMQLIAYYEGLAASALKYRFNLCPGCGKDHDKEFFEQENAKAHQELEVKTEPNPSEDKHNAFIQTDMLEEIERQKSEIKAAAQVPDHLPRRRLLTQGELKAMKEYGLDDARDAETGELVGFLCTNCGMMYQSIEDRMRRKAGKEGCDGCIQKEKWG